MILDAALPPVPDGIDETAWAAAISAVRGYCGWHIAPILPEKWSEKGTVFGRWASGLGSISVVFEHGFEFFPQEVLAVARSLASAGPNGTIGKRLTSGPHSIELGDHAAGPFALGPIHLSILDRYRVGVRP